MDLDSSSHAQSNGDTRSVLGLVDTTQTVVVPADLRLATTHEQARHLVALHVLPAIRQAHDACLVALDAWLESPVTMNPRNYYALLGQDTDDLTYDPREDREGCYRLRHEPHAQQEKSIRFAVKVLDSAAHGTFLDGWSRARCLALMPGAKASAPNEGRRDLFAGPRGFLNAVYAEFREGITSNAIHVSFGIGALRRPNVSKREGPPLGPDDVGVIDHLSLADHHNVPVSVALADALVELDRCMREVHTQAARVRAALSTHRAPSPRHGDFVAWMLTHDRPVTNKDVREWVREQRGLPVGHAWGAQDPAGPLLRRYCEKQGAPGSRAPWVLRDEVRAAHGGAR